MPVSLLFCSVLPGFLAAYNVPAACDSEIFCQGDLLHQVQLAGIYNDSKTFVDKSLKSDPNKVLKKFDELKLKYRDGKVPKDILQSFVDQNFLDEELLAVWKPADWTPNPSIAKKIDDPKLKKWALKLNGIWKTLSRKIPESIVLHPERHSLLYVPNGFVIPGGRFQEIYYWDSLWIVNGLLLCDMIKTAKGMIENLLYLVRQIGHVPNGNRNYYIQRSQPPVLTFMIDSYYKLTGDFKFIKRNIDVLDKEMDYWSSARMIEVNINGIPYTMYRYHAVSSGPRPESYREDWRDVNMKNETEQMDHYIELKSGAESGWDFSSRWFVNEGSLKNIGTSTIIPVDLNAIIHKCFCKLSEWYNKLGNSVKSKQYEDLATQLQSAIDKVFWNEEDGIWYDYDLTAKTSRKFFYLSNFVPLWTKSYKFPPFYVSKKIMRYIAQNGIMRFTGGTPASLEHSQQQWDYPNAWPPLQAILIQGLEEIGTREASHAAFQLATVWLKANYNGFKKYNKMFEKYNSLSTGEIGQGGEYVPQDGFGWTNGVALELLNKYGNELRADFFDNLV